MTERQTTPPWGPEQHAAGPSPWDGLGGGEARLGGYAPRGLADLSAALIAVLEALRRIVPVELQEQVVALQRELLLTLRALIDWYLERIDGRARAPQVEDIPID